MVFFRTVLFYLSLILVIRLMGKRQVGEMEPSEFVVTMLISNLAAIPLEDMEIPVWMGLVPMFTILVLERFLSWACMRSIRLRRVLCGKPVILIDNGKLLMDNLRRTRVTLDELSGHVREQGVLAFEAVQFAILETNGTVTVFPYPRYQPACAMDAGVEAGEQELPYTVISDGKLLRENLELVGKSEAWLRDMLHGKGCAIADVALMTITPKGKSCLIRRDQPGVDSKSH